MAGEYDADYMVLKLDLALFAGKIQQEVVQDGRPIASVTVNTLPVPAVGQVSIRFGAQNDAIPLRQEAVSIMRVPARSNGLYIDVAAGQTGFLILVIGIDTGLSVQA